MTKISLITVVKNNLSGISKTMKSVKMQSFKKYEHIIIDSNSNDGTSNYIKKYKDSKMIYIREKDNGIYNAINKGIKKSSGKFIGLLHSGDFFLSENTLSLIYKKLYNQDFIFGNVAYYEDKKINRIWNFESNVKIKNNPFKIPHTSLYIKRNIIKNDLKMYDENFKIASDLELLIRLSKKNYNYKKIDNYLIFMESGGLSFSYKNFLKKLSEDLRIIYKHYNYLFLLIYLYKLFIKINGLFSQREINKVSKKFDKIIKKLTNI